MRVLVLSQHYWPESFRINEVTLSLIGAGCEVSVLAGQPNYPSGTTYPGFRAWGVGRQRHEAGYDIYRVPEIPRGRGTALALTANYLSFIMSACVLGPWLLRKKCFDVIFVYGSSPIFQAVPGILLKKLTGAPLVTWVQDLWPQSLEVTGFVRNRGVLFAMDMLVRWVYQRNDLLLGQSEAFVPAIRAGAGHVPVDYHPNPGELAFTGDRPQGDPALHLEQDLFNVVFAGNLGTVQALDTILDAAEQLRCSPDIRFVLIGNGSRAAWLHDEVARRGLGNVQLPGGFPPEAMPGILAQASVLLVSLARNPAMSQTIPSKVQAYLAAGRPIIAALDGEGARVVEASRAGIACRAEDAEALARSVLRLRDIPIEGLAAMGAAGREYFESNYQPAVLAQELMRRFKGLSDRRPRWMRANHKADVTT